MCKNHTARPVRSFNTVLGRYVRECPECTAETTARMNTLATN